MMSPGLAYRDPYQVPDHVREMIQRNMPLGFFSGTMGKALDVHVCGMCGIPMVVSQVDLADPTAPNKIGSLAWCTRPEDCRFCGPIYARYPEVTQWVANLVAWREFVGSQP